MTEQETCTRAPSLEDDCGEQWLEITMEESKKTVWVDLCDEEDFRGICDQLLAEDLGYPTI